MLRGLISPHLLLASANPMRMIQNLNHLLEQDEIAKLTAELDHNVVLLFRLGEIHFDFASRLENADWRQKVSRLYYAVYNVKRAVSLKHSGTFSTDSSDHKTIDQLPDALDNREAHAANLRSLREDRNLSDYSHLAAISDLVRTPADWQLFATSFIMDCRAFLKKQGVVV